MPPPDYIEATNELADLALRQAKLILEYGPAPQRLAVIKSVLGVLARQAATQQDQTALEMRHRMETLMAEMRNVPQLPLVVGEEDFIVEAEVVDE